MKTNYEYYMPMDIPNEILSFDGDISQLAVGKAGKLGCLQLRFERDSQTKKTVLKEQFSKVPLVTQRVLYLEEGLPSMAYLFIVSASGGILQGDRYRIDIILNENSLVHLTTQGATRLYKMEKNFATQIININVKKGGYFEFIPDQIIPFLGARFYQKVDLKVHEDATVIYSEILVSGRVESGESFAYDICYLKITAQNQEGKIQFIDNAILEPKKNKVQLEGIFGEYLVMGVMYIITPIRYINNLEKQIDAIFINFLNTLGGISILPNNCGMMVRILAKTANEIKAVYFEIIKILRKEVLDAPFSGVIKC